MFVSTRTTAEAAEAETGPGLTGAPFPQVNICGTKVSVVGRSEAVEAILEWAEARESRYVCAANVHVVMTGHDDPQYREALNRADIVLADGRPLYWASVMLGHPDQEHFRGPDLVVEVCRGAAARGIPVALLGSTPRTLGKLERNLCLRHPGLKVAFRHSPPFRQQTKLESELLVRRIHNSGAGIVLVGLGCPKQEQWMAAHAGNLHAVMIGVGAAFDIHAGTKPAAPRWMQRTGLEWLFRLGCEPRRLWRRYVCYNPRFIAGLLLQMSRKLVPESPRTSGRRSALKPANLC